nr:zinc finger BED domain-containing protein 4-like [Ciona intestinalis]|eukprot:XP_009858708.1 zinc finger BED domain-containing protein 4-like [Ciona intestinalis]
MTTHGKFSAVWKYYDLENKESVKAKCNICGIEISRGKTIGSFTTSALWKHLARHDIDVAGSSQKPTETESVPKKRQATLKEVVAKKQCFDASHPTAAAITNALAEMIAVDFLPLSIVECVGFKRLINTLQPRYSIPSRKYLTTNKLPSIYNNVQKKIKEMLKNSASLIYGTTDIWTSRQQVSYASLTGHFVMWNKGELKLAHVVLACSQFEDKHTSEHILNEIKKQESAWDVKFSALTTDNAGNVVKALKDGSIGNVRCMAHTINLIVQNALNNAQRSVNNTVSRIRHIVGQFNRSPSKTSALRKYQLQHSDCALELIQDMPVRWNSTFAMIQRIVELREVINYLSTNDGICDTLPFAEWKISQSLVTILEIFDVATKEVSRESATLSIILPLKNSILMKLNNFLNSTLPEQERLAGVVPFIERLHNETSRRFAIPQPGILQPREAYFFNNEIYEKCAVASVLDPRVKLTWVSGDVQKAGIINIITQTAISCLSDVTRNMESAHDTELNHSSSSSSSEQNCSSLAFAALETEGVETTSCTGVAVSEADIHRQIEQYLRKPRIKQYKNPLEFWLQCRVQWPILFKLAIDILACPPTSVSSERLFSSSGVIVSPLRNRLSPSNVEMLTFLHVNLQKLDFKY